MCRSDGSISWMRKPAIFSDDVEDCHGVSRPLGWVALLDLSGRGHDRVAASLQEEHYACDRRDDGSVMRRGARNVV
jgi:hypothetical protein